MKRHCKPSLKTNHPIRVTGGTSMRICYLLKELVLDCYAILKWFVTDSLQVQDGAILLREYYRIIKVRLIK
jgi:hypothetical protein